MAISKEAIIEAALIILNRDGIEKLTMRTLASELNIKAASLYWHVKNKEELYELIADTLCENAFALDETDSPREYLMAFYAQYRQALLRTRDAVKIFAETVPRAPIRIGMIRKSLEYLRQLGVLEENCLITSNLFNNYILSFVDFEMKSKMFPDSSKVLLDELSNWLGNQNFDEQFLYGLNVLFKGIETK